MDNFDIPNGESTDSTIPYNYNIVGKQWDIEQNQTNPIYDQFIGLRDTLVFSEKKYPGKRGAKLIIGDTEETVEIQRKNRCKVAFEPGYDTDPENLIKADIEGPYVEYDNSLGLLGAIIKEDGRYRIVHKEQVFPQPNTEQVLTYCDYFPINADGTYPQEGQKIAVFDTKGKFSKTFTGTISGTCHGEGGGSVTGSCSVKVEFKLGDIIQSMTAFGYNERDCKRGDKLVFKVVDENGNLLDLQGSSNFYSVEYLDLNKDK